MQNAFLLLIIPSLFLCDLVSRFKQSIGNPIPQSRDRCFLGSSPKRLEPTFLNGNPGFRNAFLSCLGCLRVPKAGRSPLGKRPRRADRSRVTRSRHKRPPSPVYASLAGSPPFIPFRRSRALDRPAWFAVVAGFNTGPLPKKIMGHEFFLSADLSKTRSFNHMSLISNMFHV